MDRGNFIYRSGKFHKVPHEYGYDIVRFPDPSVPASGDFLIPARTFQRVIRGVYLETGDIKTPKPHEHCMVTENLEELQEGATLHTRGRTFRAAKIRPGERGTKKVTWEEVPKPHEHEWATSSDIRHISDLCDGPIKLLDRTKVFHCSCGATKTERIEEPK